MRSHSRRLLLFGILAIAVVAELAVLTVDVLRDPRPKTVAAPPQTTVSDAPQPVETPHSRELTKVLEGFAVLPNSKVRLNQPFRWQPSRYQGVDYGERYSASGTVVDAQGSHLLTLRVSVGRTDRDKLVELRQEATGLLAAGRCHPVEVTSKQTCVERFLRDGPAGGSTVVALTTDVAQGHSALRAVRPDGCEIAVDVWGVAGAANGDVGIDAEAMFAFAGLADLRP
jgi:hypothetical protein